MARRVPCSNPLCACTLLREVRAGNKSGFSQFCSKTCFSVWNPKMREVAEVLGASDPVSFKRALTKSISNVGVKITSVVLSVSPKQLERWISRLPDDYPPDLIQVNEARIKAQGTG